MGISVTLNVKGSPELNAALRKLGADAPRGAGAALYQEAETIMGASKLEVPVDMGPLRASGFVELPKFEGTRATVTMGYSHETAIWMHEGTGPAVGRPAFFPPPQAFAGWAARHGIPTDKGTLFVLARSIGRKGIRPRKFLSGPLQRAENGMSARLARRMEQWLANRPGGGNAP